MGSATRRQFLKTTGMTSAAGMLLGTSGVQAAAKGKPASAKLAPAAERSWDVIIIGGGTGGIAAALSACRRGLRVGLTEENDWVGGQLTSQAVPPDENPWIEQGGCTQMYSEFRQRVRDYYKRLFPLTPAAAENPQLNPGGGWVSRLCHEPRAAWMVLMEMAAPYVHSGRLGVFTRTKAVRTWGKGDRVEAVEIENQLDGHREIWTAPYFIDATELGDLLPMTGAEYRFGAESIQETEEPHATEKPEPLNQQAFTLCFPLEYIDGEDFTISKPDRYSFWSSFIPPLDPPWPGKLFSWVYTHPSTLKPKDLGFDPIRKAGFWSYRQIMEKDHFEPGFFKGNVSLVNWPQNDYLLGTLIDVEESVFNEHVAAAAQMNQCLLYWMQTEAPRPDGGTGWKGLRLRPDMVGTQDGMAQYPYIRESRRMRTEFTVTENHVGTEARMKLTGLGVKEVRAAKMGDSVGIGYYRIDLHPSVNGRNYVDFASLPFQIPLGSLIHERMDNLLPACKNLGVTHITNGCYRLHPIEWNIGEAVGALVAQCIERNKKPREIRNCQQELLEFQTSLVSSGVKLEWPESWING